MLPTLTINNVSVSEGDAGMTNAVFTVTLSAPTLGMSSLYKLFEAFIALREKNERQHKLFEQTLNRTRDSLEGRFNAFAGETQKAYQQLRQEVLGEKKFSLTLLNELLDLAIELDHILTARPAVPGLPFRAVEVAAVPSRSIHPRCP